MALIIFLTAFLVAFLIAFLTAQAEANKHTCKMAGTTGANLLKNLQEVVVNAQMVFLTKSKQYRLTFIDAAARRKQIWAMLIICHPFCPPIIWATRLHFFA